mgnify:CR=1 FL=1
MKKKLIYIGIFASLLVSCTESLEDKAAREAKEYTEKYCPTPYVNDSRTDSATFDKTTKVYTYYVTLRNKADNKQAIDANREKLHKLQKEALDNNPGLKKYKDVYYIDCTNATDCQHESSVDGTHPGDHGYTLWAESIRKPILKILKKYGIR